MRRSWILLTAYALAGCENPEGQTERFLAEATKNVEVAGGKTTPLPSYKAREVVPLVIERNPFKR